MRTRTRPKLTPKLHAKSCERKRAFDYKPEAVREALRLRATTGSRVKAYKCRACRKWHVGGRHR